MKKNLYFEFIIDFCDRIDYNIFRTKANFRKLLKNILEETTMKKALSLLLAVIMLMSAMTLFASAEYELPYQHHNCTAETHDGLDDCRCCIYCDNIDTQFIRTGCAKYDPKTDIWSVCCNRCNGLLNCDCGCDCCPNVEYKEEGNPTLIPEPVQNSLVEGFRNALNKVIKVFDEFFDRIFEFLRIEDFFG